MNPSTGLRFLRPYLHRETAITRKAAYLRLYNTTKCLGKRKEPASTKPLPVTKDLIAERKTELIGANALNYPRIQQHSNVLRVKDFDHQYRNVQPLQPGESVEGKNWTLRGRILNQRIASKSLVFLDVIQDGHQIQIVLDSKHLDNDITKDQFIQFYHLARRGDIISASGIPYCSQNGQLSLRITQIPTLLSPSIVPLPHVLEGQESRIRNRHIDLLVNREVSDTLRARSEIISQIRKYLENDGFIEVQTPIITDKASGAIARPFTTIATEFSDRELALRIAPEIWLKRLILGGLDRVFEIGPVFRNEGLDATHNPEYTTCEFYKSYADLESLIKMTEEMVSGLAMRIDTLQKTTAPGLQELDAEFFKGPFNRIEFIPAIEAGLGEKLPNLTDEDAEEQILAIYEKHSLTPPQSPTLPRLLDKLAAVFIEPDCTTPTFIVSHPACMAPLSKSYLCPSTSQLVSARAELFIHNKEVANMYEEENSPFEQRRKFIEQARWKDGENAAWIDESYLEALESGLPPTGGWGAGIERLVMCLTGRTRIADVLAFGSLRNVVNLGRDAGRVDKSVESEISKIDQEIRSEK